MPSEEVRPGAHDLETSFIFVPHGAPDSVEWKRAHPGWVSVPDTFVPHLEPIPRWTIINGRRWPLGKKGRPWPKARCDRPARPAGSNQVNTYPSESSEPDLINAHRCDTAEGLAHYARTAPENTGQPRRMLTLAVQR